MSLGFPWHVASPWGRQVGGGVRLRGFAILTVFAAGVSANSPTHALAQAPAAVVAAAPALSSEELDQLLGRISLYPDDLVAIVLPASCEPRAAVQPEPGDRPGRATRTRAMKIGAPSMIGDRVR